METHDNNDIHIKQLTSMITPVQLMKNVPTTIEATQNVHTYREGIKRILSNDDDRMLVVCGPCSIHNTKECMVYAQHLKKLAAKHAKHLLIVMRT